MAMEQEGVASSGGLEAVFTCANLHLTPLCEVQVQAERRCISHAAEPCFGSTWDVLGVEEPETDLQTMSVMHRPVRCRTEANHAVDSKTLGRCFHLTGGNRLGV